MKPGFFDRTATIRSHEEMMQRLAERTGKSDPVRPVVNGPIDQTRSETADLSAALQGPTVQLGAVKPDAQPSELRRAAPQLAWMPPKTKPNGSGRQCAGGTPYEVRKTITGGKLLYWAWHDKKLLGYCADVGSARQMCQTHFEANP